MISSNPVEGNETFELVPPSVEELKAQFRQKRLSKTEYDVQYAKNRKQAIKELLQENEATNTRVNNEKLNSKFLDGIEGR